eukprot:8919669-Pyramimonas_sp.AAC.1
MRRRRRRRKRRRTRTRRGSRRTRRRRRKRRRGKRRRRGLQPRPEAMKTWNVIKPVMDTMSKAHQQIIKNEDL